MRRKYSHTNSSIGLELPHLVTDHLIDWRPCQNTDILTGESISGGHSPETGNVSLTLAERGRALDDGRRCATEQTPKLVQDSRIVSPFDLDMTDGFLAMLQDTPRHTCQLVA